MKGDVVETGKLNDYILPGHESSGFGQRHFMIHFSVERNGYFLKDTGDSTGTFIKVDPDQSVVLRNGNIITYGDNHMVVGLVLERKDKEDNSLMQ